MTGNTLHFVHSTTPPSTDVRVFDSLTTQFLGAEFTFRVIGSSHYVSAPAYDFHELSSCDPVGGDDVTTLRLDGATSDASESDPGSSNSDPGSSHSETDRLNSETDRFLFEGDAARRLDYVAEGLRCATVVERQPLAAFPDGDSFDLAYRFGEDAVTTIDLRTDGYETYHTYPEFDLALYTRTVFESVPCVALDAPTDDSAPNGQDPLGQPTD